MDRKGQMLSEEVIGLVIAAACAAGVIFFLIVFVFPGYDQANKISESYLDMVENAVKVADEGGKGSFYLLDTMKATDEKVDFYLVYFGEKAIFEDEKGRVFGRMGGGVNTLCVCSYENDGVCADCLNLEFPAVYVSGSSGKISEWAVSPGVRLIVERRGDNYVFEEF